MNLFPKMYGEDRVGLFILLYIYDIGVMVLMY